MELKTAEIESAHQQHKSKLVCKIANEVTKRKKTDSGRLKASSPSERIDAWKNHFSSLLGSTTSATSTIPIHNVVDHELPITTDDFTLEVLRTCIRSLKNNKASGLADIPGEVWKTGALNAELLDFCNTTLNGDKPKIWSASGIIPVP